jgi:hypothetical protein
VITAGRLTPAASVVSMTSGDAVKATNAGGAWRLRRCEARRDDASPEENPMLETLAVILVLMWLLGMVTSYTMSGFIHLLLLLALVVVVIRLLSGRRVLS